MARIAQENLLELCAILGFTIASKSEPQDVALRGLNPSMNSLGVQLDFPAPRSGQHVLTASLPPDKRTKYIAQTLKVSKQATLRKSEAESITGRAVYVSSAIWGRVARAYEHPFRKIAEGLPVRRSEWHRAARSLAEFYANASPRHILPLAASRPHAVIATDARGNPAGEWASEHLGGICFWNHTARWFSDTIQAGLFVAFSDSSAISDAQHRINIAEALAALVALVYWRQELAGHQVILLIDNMAAEGTLQRGYSPDVDLCRITNRFWQICNAYDIILWVDRVPSAYNIADPLSRGDFSDMKLLDCTRSESHKTGRVDFEYLVDRRHSTRT